MTPEEMQSTHDAYEPKIQKLLAEICEEAGKRGYDCKGPFDRGDEEYQWSITVLPEGGDDEEAGVDISITILESDVRGDDEGGVAFSLEVVSYEGEVLGQLTPYNYTADLWVPVKDEDAVRDRWNLFSGALDETEIIESVSDHFAKAPAPAPKQPPAPSVGDIEVINRHRQRIGMGPIDPAAGWTKKELRAMAESIRTTGRMQNPRTGQLKRRLMR